MQEFGKIYSHLFSQHDYYIFKRNKIVHILVSTIKDTIVVWVMCPLTYINEGLLIVLADFGDPC